MPFHRRSPQAALRDRRVGSGRRIIGRIEAAVSAWRRISGPTFRISVAPRRGPGRPRRIADEPPAPRGRSWRWRPATAAARLRPQVTHRGLHSMTTPPRSCSSPSRTPSPPCPCSSSPTGRVPHAFGERTYHVRIAPAAFSAQHPARIAEGVLATSRLPAEIVEILARAGRVTRSTWKRRDRQRVRIHSRDGRRLRGGSSPRYGRGAEHDPGRDHGPHRPAGGGAQAHLQLASVIGREFTRRLLDHLAAAESYRRGPARAQGHRAIRETQRVPEPASVFRHALTQDVAYQSLRERRKECTTASVGHRGAARRSNRRASRPRASLLESGGLGQGAGPAPRRRQPGDQGPRAARCPSLKFPPRFREEVTENQHVAESPSHSGLTCNRLSAD